jgi:glucosamine--fructose-6-phosphate aminotransferase (isomerizing)
MLVKQDKPMTERGEYTYADIFSQPESWAKARNIFQAQAQTLTALWQSNKFERVLLTGCGSTYYLAQIGAGLIQELTGVNAQAVTASELMLFPQVTLTSSLKTLFITVSRSGTTRETVEAVRLFRKYGTGHTLTFTCHSESVLAQEADSVCAIDTARETSRVQTRSFSSMAVLLTAFALTIAGKNAAQELATLPNTLQRMLDDYSNLARTLGERQDFTQFIFLGSGVLHGLACEAMLKMAEMSLVPSIAFHALEFLHGPKYTVTDKTLVVGLLNEAIRDEELAAVKEAQKRGATLLVIMETATGLSLGDSAHIVALQSHLSLPVRVILYLPILQLIGYWQAMTRGKNPDFPQ